jgi:hypothetical protein
MLFAEFKEKIESTYKAVFPNSRCDCIVWKCLGKSICIDCYFTKEDTECAHGIIDNDMFMVKFMIGLPDKFDAETEELPNILEMRALQNSFRVKPIESCLWCSYKKVPYRKTRGNPAKLCETFGRFVNRLYKSVCEERDNNNIHQNDLPLIAEKIV